MRFSTVAASAVLIGFAAALPNSVVYETEMVTITSCSPDKPDCPYATPTSTPVEPIPEYPSTTEYPTPEYPTTTEYPEVSSTPCSSTTEYPEVSSTPCSTTTDVYPPTYPNATASYPPTEPSSYPEEPTPEYPEEPTPEYPQEPTPEYPPYVPTGTGVPYPPANTSYPSIPTSPPEYEGAGAKMGASLIAVAGAAIIALLA